MDQINFTLSLDNFTKEQLDPLAPYKSTFDFNAPRKVSGNLAFPKPAASSMASWIEHPHGDVVDPSKLARMKTLATNQ